MGEWPVKLPFFAFLAFLGGLIFLAVFIVDRQTDAGVDRVSRMRRPQSVLEADPSLKLVSERSPYMRTER
jgi:hypothetical protein